MKKLFYLLPFVLLLAACRNDDDAPNPFDNELALEIVTGLQARDANAAPVGQFGNPNTFTGEVDAFPNPAIGELRVQYYGANNLQVKQYWIFAAPQNTDYADVDYGLLLANNTYSPDEVSDLTIEQTNTVNLSSFILNTDTFSPGYFRIFYLMSDETLLWDNIYVDPSATDYFSLLSEVSSQW